MEQKCAIFVISWIAYQFEFSCNREARPFHGKRDKSRPFVHRKTKLLPPAVTKVALSLTLLIPLTPSHPPLAMPDLFSVPIFFVLFRETTEAAIIVSVLLTFLRQMFVDNPELLKRYRRQVWIGTLAGLLISVAIGAAFIAVWYTVASNLWESSENIWEGCFSLLATVLITLMGIMMLKSNRMQEKWQKKLSKKVNEENQKGFAGRYAFFLLPFITVLREGLEAVVFLGGISIGASATSIPLAAICGIIAGALVGFIIYKTGNIMRLHWFFIISTYILFLIAAGLFSRAIGFFEKHTWALATGGGEAEEGGDQTGTFNVLTNVWYLTCCNPEDYSNNGGWAIFNSILGWNNIASVGTITGYCLYWVVLSVALVILKIRQRRRDANEHAYDSVDTDIKEKEAELEAEDPKQDKPGERAEEVV
ncbi:uncharacterized protein VTP21DRAFT_5047 [Calcarisporiella thermophila]|uniref:uncharacterized protein n=1 Tax=Calcarisporiella thermophila TaxID=911321 RepID=UPI003742685C